MKLLRMAFIVAAAVGSTACFDMFKNIFNSPTTPSDTAGAVRSYLGTWVGPAVMPAAAELQRIAVEDHIAERNSGKR